MKISEAVAEYPKVRRFYASGRRETLMCYLLTEEEAKANEVEYRYWRDVDWTTVPRLCEVTILGDDGYVTTVFWFTKMTWLYSFHTPFGIFTIPPAKVSDKNNKLMIHPVNRVFCLEDKGAQMDRSLIVKKLVPELLARGVRPHHVVNMFAGHEQVNRKIIEKYIKTEEVKVAVTEEIRKILNDAGFSSEDVAQKFSETYEEAKKTKNVKVMMDVLCKMGEYLGWDGKSVTEQREIHQIEEVRDDNDIARLRKETKARQVLTGKVNETNYEQ